MYIYIKRNLVSTTRNYSEIINQSLILDGKERGGSHITKQAYDPLLHMLPLRTRRPLAGRGPRLTLLSAAVPSPRRSSVSRESQGRQVSAGPPEPTVRSPGAHCGLVGQARGHLPWGKMELLGTPGNGVAALLGFSSKLFVVWPVWTSPRIKWLLGRGHGVSRTTRAWPWECVFAHTQTQVP